MNEAIKKERLVGDVLHYARRRGYGHIAGSDGNEYFFHISNVSFQKGLKVLPQPGDLFTFSTRPSIRRIGSFEAYDLVLIRRRTVIQTVTPEVPADSAVKESR